MRNNVDKRISIYKSKRFKALIRLRRKIGNKMDNKIDLYTYDSMIKFTRDLKD